MRVDQLWRYPVKSLRGEPLAAVAVGVLGVEGDRLVAVHDERDEVTWAGAVPALRAAGAVLAVSKGDTESTGGVHHLDTAEHAGLGELRGQIKIQQRPIPGVGTTTTSQSHAWVEERWRWDTQAERLASRFGQ